MRRKYLNVLITTALIALLVITCANYVKTNDSASTKSEVSIQLDETLPVDPNLRTGVLENGVRYYIRENEKPENRAELRLALNAGSILESDDQQGLAHFTEHMAFNGTEHFEKQELINYLESIGMRFGADLNAYTTFDETVYMLEVPTDSLEVMNTAFQILEDWAHLLRFTPEEIEKERGVILEEWRLGRGANARMRDEQLPVLFQGSRYAERLPIGDTTVIKSFEHKTLKRFYTEWYRPDLMAVIAVGDFNADAIMNKISTHFARLTGAENLHERTVFPVPGHEETLCTIASDPEASRSAVSIYYKLDPLPESTVRDYRRTLVENLYNRLLNKRLDELTQQADPPFLYGYSGKGSIVRSKDVYTLSVGVRNNGIERGLEALFTEARRVTLHGFTPTELQREKQAMLRSIENAYNERDKTKSRRFASEYIRHFLSGEPLPGIEYEYQLYQQYVPDIRLEEVNQLASAWISDSNRVIMANHPDKPGITPPTRDGLLEIMDEAEEKSIDPYVDRASDEPLVDHPVVKGTVVKTSSIETLGVTEWTLDNGIRVTLKPTDFKNDEVRFTGFSPGGLSLVSAEDYIPGETAVGIITNGGVGNYNRAELEKYLTGKVVSVRPYIGELEEGFSGRASPGDLETMFELIYAYMVAPRVDSTAFLSYHARLEGYLENRNARPETAFSDSIQVILSQHHPRSAPWSREMLESLDMEASYQIFQSRFADAGDFHFVFVGNFSPDTLKEYVERYMGALPDVPGTESWRDVGIRYPKEVIRENVFKGIELKSRVQLIFTGKFDWNPENQLMLDVLAGVFKIKLREVLREDMGGTYGVGVGMSASEYPAEEYRFNIGFGCHPDRVAELVEAVFRQVDTLRSSGIDERYLQKVKEAKLRTRETQLKENRFWIRALKFSFYHQLNPLEITDYERKIDRLSIAKIKQAARQYLSPDRYVRVVLFPESYAPGEGAK